MKNVVIEPDVLKHVISSLTENGKFNTHVRMGLLLGETTGDTINVTDVIVPAQESSRGSTRYNMSSMAQIILDKKPNIIGQVLYWPLKSLDETPFNKTMRIELARRGIPNLEVLININSEYAVFQD